MVRVGFQRLIQYLTHLVISGSTQCLSPPKQQVSVVWKMNQRLLHRIFGNRIIFFFECQIGGSQKGISQWWRRLHASVVKDLEHHSWVDLKDQGCSAEVNQAVGCDVGIPHGVDVRDAFFQIFGSNVLLVVE